MLKDKVEIVELFMQKECVRSKRVEEKHLNFDEPKLR